MSIRYFDESIVSSIDQPSLWRYTAITQPFLNQFAKSWAHWKEDIEIYQKSSRNSKLAQIARNCAAQRHRMTLLIDLNVLFPMSPRFCKLVKKWLSYGGIPP
eukprot:sb/3478341/